MTEDNGGRMNRNRNGSCADTRRSTIFFLDININYNIYFINLRWSPRDNRIFERIVLAASLTVYEFAAVVIDKLHLGKSLFVEIPNLFLVF